MAFKILDASAFYAGIPFAVYEKVFTTNLVYEEIKHIKKNHEAVEIIIENGRLVLINPDKKYVDETVSIAKNTGDFHKLSQQDLSVISLALQYKDNNGLLITDDYSVSNVARSLGIQVCPIMTRGPSKRIIWNHFCPGCNQSFETKKSYCPLCGNKLVLRRSRVKGLSKR